MSATGDGTGTIRVLLVEDDADQAAIVRRVLVRHDARFEVVVAPDGDACFRALAEGPYAVILLDYSLPRMNGLEVLQQLAREVPTIPVVMVTSQGDERIAIEAIKAGATDYVIKTAGYLTTLPTVLGKALKQHAMMVENARLVRETQQELRRNETLLAVSRGLSSTLELTEILRSAIREMVHALGACTAGAWLLTPDGDELFPVVGYHVPPEALAAVEAGVRNGGTREIARLVQTLHGPLYASDSRSDPRLRVPLFEPFDHRGILLVPTWSKERVIGLFCIAWLRPTEPLTPKDLDLAEAIARQTGIVIENARLYAESERRRQEAETSERRFRDLVEGIDAIVWEADAATGRFSFVSHQAEVILGFPVSRWLEASDFWMERLHPDDRAVTLEGRRAARSGEAPHELQYRMVAADGRLVWLRERTQVVRDGDGQPVQLRGVMVDTTARIESEHALRRSEEQLRQSHKMDAIGRLAGGIAHDFNNVLAIIMGRGELLVRALDGGRAPGNLPDQIIKAAERGAGLTRQLLAFSRKQVLQPKVLDLNHAVIQLVGMLERVIGEDITLETVLDPALGRINVDPGQLDQVLMNLVVNARDAMPDGGCLTITTANTLHPRFEDMPPGASPAHVVLSVADTGYGMTPETRDRIFEPFFTTKGPGRGTGLGLSTVYGIIQQHDGHIVVESEPGRGSRFTVYLPRVEDPVDAPPSDATADADAPAIETVLLVEDEDEVRGVVHDLLVGAGYTVLTAANGHDALAQAAAFDGPIHLLLTDVVMPQMGGPVLAQRFAAVRPEAKVLYMSGYLDDALTRNGVLDSGTALLQKPFQADGLLRKVRGMLEIVGPEMAPQRPARPGGAVALLDPEPRVV